MDDAQADARVRGETTEPVPNEDVPVQRGDLPYDDDEPDHDDFAESVTFGHQPMRPVTPVSPPSGRLPSVANGVSPLEGDEVSPLSSAGEQTPDTGSPADDPAPDEETADHGEPTVDAEQPTSDDSTAVAVLTVEPIVRGRRGRGRVPVPS